MAAIRAVVLVEGVSDRRALEALAVRRGRDLRTAGVDLIDMGGVHAIAQFLERYGPCGSGVAVAGLYDVAEEPDVRRGLERAGFGSTSSRPELVRLGFYACIDDLEDELIRAAGTETVLDIVKERGDSGRSGRSRSTGVARTAPRPATQALPRELEPKVRLRGPAGRRARSLEGSTPARRGARSRLSPARTSRDDQRP